MKRAGDCVFGTLTHRGPGTCSCVERWCRHLSSLRGAAEKAERATSPWASGEPVWEATLPVDPSPYGWLKWHPADSRPVPDREGPSLAPRHTWVEQRSKLRKPVHVPSNKTYQPEPNCTIQNAGRAAVTLEALSKLCDVGELNEVVEALTMMVQHGHHADDTSLYTILRRCMAKKDLELGRRVHALAVESGHESDAFLANHIIGMYASHGKLDEAVQVFKKVAAPNAHVWASIISAHARHGQSSQAINLYRRMRDSLVKPDSHVYVAVLKACATAVDLASGKEVHSDMVVNRVQPDVYIGSCLVDMYSKCGSVLDARSVFDFLPNRDVVTWNAMIAGYAQHGLGQEALDLYTEMQNDSTTVADRVTFASLLQACAATEALHQGKQLHLEIQQKGLEADVVVGNSLVNMYAKCGSLEDACTLFERLPRKDVVTWNAMIAGYARNGHGQQAISLYEKMQRNSSATPNQSTFVCLLQACAASEDLHKGKELHGQIRTMGLETNVAVGNCLVDMYSKCGSIDDARQVFDRMQTRTAVTWTAIVAAYVQHGLSEEALKLYAEMQQAGISPSSTVTFVCLLKACASAGALHQGKQLHAQIQQRGLEADVAVGSCLVDMYVKSGSLVEARRVFDRLPTKNVVTWTAMLNGYAQQGDSHMAIECFEQMRQQGLEPNDVTFNCLFVACSHQGLVKDGERYFRMMVKDHGIMPSDYHYNCMVELFGRSGRLDEAENMLETMPFETNIVGWTSLLTACRSHGDVERGKRCFDRLITWEPDYAVAYALLGNIYANAGRWGDVGKLETLRKSAQAWKKPAKASIEVEKKVHEFTLGDDRSDILSKLKSMNLRVKEVGGHVPHTELVLKAVSEQEKENALCGHAEKLALAYGLLNTPAGTALLVTKNLRMCNDCHSSTKIMSRLERREITVRDAHIVHRFVDGSCSCGDR